MNPRDLTYNHHLVAIGDEIVRKLGGAQNYVTVHVRRGDKTRRPEKWPHVEQDTRPERWGRSQEQPQSPPPSLLACAAHLPCVRLHSGPHLLAQMRGSILATVLALTMLGSLMVLLGCVQPEEEAPQVC